MAGGKETPRQKMIGMMYLVLTALLALQVSSAVLEKFAIINETMEGLVVDGNQKNSRALATIVEEAGKSSNSRVVNAKNNAVKVRELTSSTMTYIDELKKKFLVVSKAEEVDEKFITNHASDVATMMIDPKSPVGKEFVTTLDTYVKELGTLTGLEYPTLAKAPKDMPIFATNEDHVRKDFLTFTFENTPGIAAYASVTQIQTEILEYESRALDKLLADANIGVVKIDKFVPMVRPVSSVVAAGSKYEADMFLSGSSSSFTPDMSMDGKPLELIDDPSGVKMGKVEFTATAGNYDPKTNLARKTFSAEIHMKDTIIKQDIEYFVAKPIIRVTTGNAPTLYMNCGNSVMIEVPALGSNYNPTFSGNGAKILKGDKPGRVTIIPNQRKVSVTVSNAGTVLGSEPFDVKPIPRPRYVAKESSGREINLKTGIRGSALASFRIVAEADENFKQEVPKDANYRIRSMEVIHARGTSPINTMTATNENIDVSRWRSQFKPGDNIVVEIKTVTRRTYENSDERVEVKSEIIRIPLL
jgi:gliding motility-associated protein GldM